LGSWPHCAGLIFAARLNSDAKARFRPWELDVILQRMYRLALPCRRRVGKIIGAVIGAFIMGV